MKNQYFADTRDLFKYDLVLELLSKEKLRGFTFIPMLTPDQPEYRGGRTNYQYARAGTKRTELRNFLQKCLEGRREISMLELFFSKSILTLNVHLSIYKEDVYFSQTNRAKYFAKINRKLLSKSIILVDPDVGLEVRSTQKGQGEKYVMYEEVRSLYLRMSNNSILLLFQFIPRVNRERYLLEMCGKIRRNVTHSLPVCCISDNLIAFFVLTKNSKSLNSVSSHLQGYSAVYGLQLYSV